MSTLSISVDNSTMDIDNTTAQQIQEIHSDLYTQDSSVAPPVSQNVRQLDFALNKERQIQGIIDDANIPPFSFDVKILANLFKFSVIQAPTNKLLNLSIPASQKMLSSLKKISSFQKK